MSEVVTGRTKGGATYIPQFIVAVDPSNCLGCGRCYKVCSRDVFELIEREFNDEDDEDEDDDVMMVMAVKDADDCIGCGACSRVCPKSCHSFEEVAA